MLNGIEAIRLIQKFSSASEIKKIQIIRTCHSHVMRMPHFIKVEHNQYCKNNLNKNIFIS